jgi:Sulfotransferase family
MSRLPNFFIVGAPKAGSTSLYHYLDQHPDVFMSPIKEPNFFAAELREENCVPELRRSIARDNPALRNFLSGPMREKRFGGIVSDWDDYLRLFANAADESVLGEASACYLWSPTAPGRIAAAVPHAKILVMLRDPADRAFSQYLHGLGNGAIRWTFREHIQRNLLQRSGQIGVHYPFLEFGLYSEQLCRYLKCFGQNVRVEFHEDFKDRPTEVLRNIYRFLNVDPEFSPDRSHRYQEAQVPRTSAIGWLRRSGLWEAAAHLTPRGLRPFIRRSLIRKPGATRMDPADRHYLIDFYREDVRKLENLLGRNLDAWLHDRQPNLLPV